MATMEPKTVVPPPQTSKQGGFLSRHNELKVLPFSIFIHLGILALIGGAVITQQVIPSRENPITTMVKSSPSDKKNILDELPENPAAPENPETPPEEPVKNPDTAPPETYHIITTPQGAAPPIRIGPGFSNSGLPSAFPGTGPGTKSQDQLPPPKPSQIKKIWGEPIAANRLGVIVDISGSAHAYLLPALKEVNKNFSDAVIILAVGCGLSHDKGEIRPLNGLEIPDYQKGMDQWSGGGLGFLSSAMAKDDELKSLVKKLRRNPDLLALQNANTDVAGAFNELIERKVDAIYWFADFQDGTNPKTLAELSRKLKSNGIRLYAHTFTGQAVPAPQAALAEGSGGKAISQVPK